ncbi:MAG: SAM-dependent methyltransferase [Rubripirellula sp.]
MRVCIFATVVLLCSTLQAGDLLSAVRAAEKSQPNVADWQPTPLEQLESILDELELTSSDTLVDFGCGDARALIMAVDKYGCRGVGIEIEPEQYRKAKLSVEARGLTDKIEIKLGDATKADIEATAGFVYLWPETLEALSPQLQKLERFASYQHAVPGLAMKRNGQAWYWETEKPKAKQVAKSEPVKMVTQRVVTGYRTVKHCNGRQCWYTQEPIYEYRQVRASDPAKKQQAKAAPKPVTVTQPVRRVAVWGGRTYTGRVCNSPGCTMCNSIAAQLRR